MPDKTEKYSSDYFVLMTSLLSYWVVAVASIGVALAENHKTPRIDARQRIEAEITNIRSLPFGYVVLCVNGDMKINSSQSATFIVRNSELCEIASSAIPLALRNDFTLCSNDPEHVVEAKHPSPPKCAELARELRSI